MRFSQLGWEKLLDVARPRVDFMAVFNTALAASGFTKFYAPTNVIVQDVLPDFQGEINENKIRHWHK